jgi:outer membrane protein TolC
MSSKIFSIAVVTTVLMSALTTTYSAEQKSNVLPEPLTLDLALSLIDQQHPDLRFVNAGVQIANSTLQKVLSNNDLTVSFKASAGWVEPSALASDQSNEDLRTSLIIKKDLYDFGRSSSQSDAVSQQIISQNLLYINANQHQYITVMKRYFDVVLADLQFYRYNEEMAVAYIRYDRMQIRAKLGQFTEVDVAEKYKEYQRIRRLRTQSESQQRVTRSLLAQALNRPNNLPTTVAKPEIDSISRELPDVDSFQKSVNQNNPILLSLRAKLAAAKNNIQFAYASDNPTISGGLEAYTYTRELGSSDKWRAQVTLDVPLWSGSREDAAVAQAKAEVYKVEAQLAQQELLTQQKVLELILDLQTLKIKYDEVLAAMNFAELSLDKNRAQYELEKVSDLGYSMVDFSEAERNVVEVGFDIALAWAQLDALSGTLLNKSREVLKN